MALGSGSDVLVSAVESARMLETDRPPAVLDVRWRLGGPPGLDSYLGGHIPGACFVDLDTDLSGPPGARGRHPLPAPGVFQSAMRRAGLLAGQLAVVYDDADSTVAARLWWMLRHYGHDNVRVLNGGFRGWIAAGLPVSTEVAEPSAGDFAVTAAAMPVLDAAGAARLARAGMLLDARAGPRYRGEVEPVDRAPGHIPGAISAPASGNVRSDGTFLPRDELIRRFADLGLHARAPEATSPAGAPVIGVYCGSGVTAAQEILALELAGLHAALYVGSWSEWSGDPSRPVATGAAPG